MLYFTWLNDRDKKKKFKMKEIDAGFAFMKDMNVDHDSIAPFLNDKNNKMQLRKNDCLLLQHKDVLRRGKKIRLERDQVNQY